MVMNRHHPLARDELVRAVIAYTGTTTDDGNIGGTALQDRRLIGSNDFITNKTILIGSGDADLEDSGAVSFAPLTGIITVSSAFSAQIKAGTIFRVLNISTVEIDVDVINTKVGTNTDPAGTTTVFAWLAKLFGVSDSQRYGDGIYFNPAGTPGTDYPTGTVVQPCSVQADVRTIAVANNLQRIYLQGDLTLDADMTSYQFIGTGELASYILDMNGQGITTCVFRDLTLVGTKGGLTGVSCYNCTVLNTDTIWGEFWNCFIENTMGIPNNREIFAFNCASGQTPTILNFAGDTVQSYLHNWKGALTINGLTGGTLSIFADSADITIGGTCTGGTINIWGNARVTDNSGAGCTVNDYSKETELDAIKTQTDKLAGEAPVAGSVSDNWQSGTGTSGETGADLVTIGANDTRYKLHSLLVNISALTLGATITVKLFMEVNGTERKVYEQPFTQGTDPDGLWIVNGTVGIHEALRVEVESNNALDNGLAIDYDYLLEAI